MLQLFRSLFLLIGKTLYSVCISIYIKLIQSRKLTNETTEALFKNFN